MLKINYSNIETVFGEPGEPAKKNFITMDTPFPLRYGDTELHKVTGHKYIIPTFITVLQEIKNIFGLAYIQEHHLNVFNGCYCFRKIKGDGDWYSVHSWGLAIDYCANLSPFNAPARTPYHIVQAFKNAGFNWGGDWNNMCDGMHFSPINEGQ